MRIGIFNNKGGVGKTTYTYHVTHVLAGLGKCVLLVDADPQCNLSAYCLADENIEQSWAPRGNSLFKNIERVHESIGDIYDRRPSQISEVYNNIWLVPGDPMLSDFEDVLADTWNRAKGGSPADMRKQTAIHRYINAAEQKVGSDITFIDMGPNLGPLNRTILTACDYFIVPVAPDLFSIRGTQNLGNKLVSWRGEWEQVKAASKSQDIELPGGSPVFLGYVRQQHNMRSNEQGMTRGWATFGNRLEAAIQQNIVDKLQPLGQVQQWADDGWDLGGIPNLHSLVPYSQEARKPIFDCTGRDGLRGAHQSKARNTRELYLPMAETLVGLM
ncbi:AAA family ATPase [Xanthomonas campestris pv. raphani]|uniref:ParA family protein n=1 Tax=Xanthomonas campestris TaxID=339 RepID=UPI0038906F48